MPHKILLSWDSIQMRIGSKFDYHIFRKKMDRADHKQLHIDYSSRAGIVHFDHSLNSKRQHMERMPVDW